ncbi:CBS domain-containing protein [Kitasatospora sp. NBC_01250]|uniref:CBS domain-containing protein n=1 Tax=unclassified Kitasatospora TaxID=2633591 RepID=UPI002E135AB4|nr:MULTISPECIES: CBS domain-containing protein [unclassified Kitasatospora]WSJ66717.1 CBS domain-containing protein [Kitasatospora sp. NBC_01302]
MTFTLEPPMARVSAGANLAATVGDLMGAPQLQISDDVTVDTAMDILHSAGTDQVLVRGEDGRCAGMVTRAQLAPFSSRSWYTERSAVRDIAHDRAPFATADMPATVAFVAMYFRGLDVWPVVDDDGHVIGLLNRRVP